MAFAIRKRNRLPHWDVDNGTYFITTNLFDAVPHEVRVRLDEECKAYVAEIERRRARMTRAEEFALNQLVRERLEEALDAGAGVCWLRQPNIARMMAGAINFFDGKRYELLAWCVMPNHIHLLFQLLNDSIDRVMKSLKTFTSREANVLVGRSGTFWQADYYDRTVRDEAELLRCVEYIRMNPVRAGLTDWPWVKIYSHRLPVAGPQVRRLRTGGPRSGESP
jgi:REP element-mobilizing transposase RayT